MDPWAIWRMDFYGKDGAAWLRREASFWVKLDNSPTIVLVGKHIVNEPRYPSDYGNGFSVSNDNVIEFHGNTTLQFDGIGPHFLEKAQEAICANGGAFGCSKFAQGVGWVNGSTRREPGLLFIEADVNDALCNQSFGKYVPIVTYEGASLESGSPKRAYQLLIQYREPLRFTTEDGEDAVERVLVWEYPEQPSEAKSSGFSLSKTTTFFRPRLLETPNSGQSYVMGVDNDLLYDLNHIDSYYFKVTTPDYTLEGPRITFGAPNLRIRSVHFDPSSCCPACPA